MANIVITPPGKFSLPKVESCGRAREVLYRFGARDVTLRYRQTVLGVVWVVLQPLLVSLVFALVFSKVAKLTVPRASPTWSSSSSGSWLGTCSAESSPGPGSLVSNRDLVSKVFFPRMLVPLAAVYSNRSTSSSLGSWPPLGRQRDQPGSQASCSRCGRFR